ncbi:VWA domain-containing protein [Aliifodinibius sp. S!AR15-10]|uniref:VWA domain-containing protein n=1 Tax=Aliifodinibius sp. S!AR15-10 TaxID=2950437 RepID=UPI00285CFE70|nr:VWA domain-containing protein [Aliifodinibius sp. S!AR15-10]MDR8390826.1 VWA domain-containing protein [Aliifodinibius sp. S!AR15-10]
MIWQDAYFLWLLLVIPLLAGGLWWYFQRLREKRKQFFSDDLFESLRIGFWRTGDRLKTVTLLVGLSFLVLAIAGPKVGTQVREVKRQGVDLLIALDLSDSMNAEDVKPSRLEKAKYEITRLIERLKGDRVGLIVFTGDAYLQSPMTLDYSALRLFLNIAETDQMPSSSTDFSAPMDVALRAFDSLDEEQNQSNAAKVMLIISDGENHGAGYSDALNSLVENNISVYTLGIGTRSGSTIPQYNSDTGSLIGYKRDQSGKLVTTRLQPETLRDIANQGEGEYYSIESGSDGIDSFLGRIDELEQGEFASQEYADFKNQYQLMAGIALGFIFISLLLPKYRKESKS